MSNLVSNPFKEGTFGTKFFRIPSILTLKNGRILASCDIRYGNGTDNPANIETGIRFSDDNGKSWSQPKFINHFDDMADKDFIPAVPSSASFIDSAMTETKDGVIYHVCDACPPFTGLWGKGAYGKNNNGFIDGKLALCKKTSSDKAETTDLTKENYPYYVGDFNNLGYAPVLKFSNNKNFDDYFVDSDYKLFQNKNNKYEPVLIKQLNEDGSLSERDITASVFYANSPLKLSPAYYLWVKKSLDGGETWSKGKILNTEINSKGFTGFAPGRGFCVTLPNGKERVMFALYDNNDGKEYVSVIYTDDGENFKRSKKANLVLDAGKSSETQIVLMNNNILRLYSRNTAGFISYCDSSDYGETWGEYKLDKALKYCSNCQISVINYSKKIDGKDALVISYPGEKTRKRGIIRIGLYGKDNVVEWKYIKKITESLDPFTFVYSCLTETKDGRIIDLYESYKAELSVVDFNIDELKVNDNCSLSIFEKIKSLYCNKFRKNLE